MMESGFGAGVSWSYTVDLRREGVASLREARADTTVTAKPIDEVARGTGERGVDAQRDIAPLPGSDREFRFERDAEIGAMLFQVINTLNDEVVFQLPTEIMLNLRKHYAEASPQGLPSFETAL